MDAKSNLLTVDGLRDLVVGVLERHKACNLVVLDISRKSTFARCMIIASGETDRHVKALAGYVNKAVKQYHRVYLEGMEEGNWVIVSFQDVLVHIFRPEVREYYGIEELWSVSEPVAAAPKPNPEGSDVGSEH